LDRFFESPDKKNEKLEDKGSKEGELSESEKIDELLNTKYDCFNCGYKYSVGNASEGGVCPKCEVASKNDDNFSNALEKLKELEEKTEPKQEGKEPGRKVEDAKNFKDLYDILLENKDPDTEVMKANLDGIKDLVEFQIRSKNIYIPTNLIITKLKKFKDNNIYSKFNRLVNDLSQTIKEKFKERGYILHNEGGALVLGEQKSKELREDNELWKEIKEIADKSLDF